jgi:hypothetical protein
VGAKATPEGIEVTFAAMEERGWKHRERCGPRTAGLRPGAAGGGPHAHRQGDRRRRGGHRQDHPTAPHAGREHRHRGGTAFMPVKPKT